MVSKQGFDLCIFPIVFFYATKAQNQAQNHQPERKKQQTNIQADLFGGQGKHTEPW